MERSYDIFEVMPDGSLMWRAEVTGHENAVAKLKHLAAQTTNELLVMHLATKAVIAIMNKPSGTKA